LHEGEAEITDKDKQKQYAQQMLENTLKELVGRALLVG